jgi:hypothetical protein
MGEVVLRPGSLLTQAAGSLEIDAVKLPGTLGSEAVKAYIGG